MRIAVLCLLMLHWTATASAGCMDTDNRLWLSPSSDRTTYDRLMQLMACPADVDKDEGRQIDHVACNWFVAKALDTLYGVKDFGPSVNGRWLNANEIVAWVTSHPKLWTRLGNAADQATLDEAAAGAGNGQPVIATMVDDPHGHVAIILPGAVQNSTTWGMMVPNSAGFSLDHVGNAYVYCRLSATFSDRNQVNIYFRVK